MRTWHVAVAAALFLSASWAQAQGPAPQSPGSISKPSAATQTQTVSEKPIAALPYTPGLDVSAMDRSADPCVDFYQYSCGGWMKSNPIPADQAGWSVYGKLFQDNQQFLWGILDDLATRTTGQNATQQKIGDYFAACMDESAVEGLGSKPLAPNLARIEGMKSKHDLPSVLAGLHLMTEGDGFAFGFGSNQDFSNSESIIAFATAGGLGLPDRDYYTKDDQRSVELRQKYVAHVQKMLRAARRQAGRRPA